ncbi:hypothetical protein JCM8202_000437 [Rhodotorula sphaerocarpa]
MTSVSSYSTRYSRLGSGAVRTSGAGGVGVSPEWIHARFERAVDMIQSLPKSGPIQTTYEQKLHLYSFYKQATEGDISGSRPGILDILGRAKWDAWNKCKGLSSLEAERLYVDALIRVLRGYKDRTLAVELMRELERFEVGPMPPVVPATTGGAAASSSAAAPPFARRRDESDSEASTATSYEASRARRERLPPATPTTTAAAVAASSHASPAQHRRDRRRHRQTPLSPDEVAPPLPGYGPPRTRADPVRYPSTSSTASSSSAGSSSRSSSESGSVRDALSSQRGPQPQPQPGQPLPLSSGSGARSRRRHRRAHAAAAPRSSQEFYPAPTSLAPSQQGARSPAPSVRPLTASNLRTASNPAPSHLPAATASTIPPPAQVPPPAAALDAALDRIQTSLTALHQRLTLLESAPAPPAPMAGAGGTGSGSAPEDAGEGREVAEVARGSRLSRLLGFAALLARVTAPSSNNNSSTNNNLGPAPAPSRAPQSGSSPPSSAPSAASRGTSRSCLRCWSWWGG